MMTYQGNGELDSSAEDRVTIWQDAMQIFHEDPIFGTGFNTYAFMGRVGPYTDTHNYYVKVLIEEGIIGLLIFLWLLRMACKMSWSLFRRASDPVISALGCGLFAMMICVVIVNFFGDRWTYLQVNGFLWVILGLAARGLQLINQEKESQEEAEPTTQPEELEADPYVVDEVSHV
jgi:O-antigen ligase